MKLPRALHVRPVRQRSLGAHAHGEHAVRPRALLVHLGLAHLPALGGARHQREDVLGPGNALLGEAHHEHASAFLLPRAGILHQPQLFGLGLDERDVLEVAVDEQVAELFVVNLQERRAHVELDVGIVGAKAPEHVERGSRDHAALLGHRQVALHGVRLSRARLPVREHRALVPLQHVADDGREGLVEHLHLRREGGEDVVEREGAAQRARAASLDHRHLLLLRRGGHDGKRVALELALGHGAKADHHLDAGLFRHDGGRFRAKAREPRAWRCAPTDASPRRFPERGNKVASRNRFFRSVSEAAYGPVWRLVISKKPEEAR